MRISRSIVVGLFCMLAVGGAFAAACDGFTDVDDANATYCPAVTYLKNKGITLGCTGTTYCPNDYVTRLQMALFLQRMGRGGPTNVLGDWSDAIGGGDGNSTANEIGGHNNVIGGGRDNVANNYYSTVAGGILNLASGFDSFVAGGNANIASGDHSSVLGGFGNVASGTYSIAIGVANIVQGDQSIVLGTSGLTTALGGGSFVFSDKTIAPGGAQFGAGSPNIFVVGASGGVYLFTNKDYSTGCSIGIGGGTWSCTSSKETKRDFADVDRQHILDQVLALPVQTWRYKNEPADIRHIGTFAQDFHEAFGVGADDKSISMADADGVALAAIQALHARLKDKDAQIDALARRLEAVETLLKH